MQKFAVFNSQALYDAWHTQIITDLFLDPLNSPYAGSRANLVDPVADPRIIVGIDSYVDETGLTVWTFGEALGYGFLDPTNYIQKKIKISKDYGENLISRIGAENVAAGMSDADIQTMSETMHPIQAAVQSGSMKLARNLLAVYVPTAYMPQARIDSLVAEVDAFLAEL